MPNEKNKGSVASARGPTNRAASNRRIMQHTRRRSRTHGRRLVVNEVLMVVITVYLKAAIIVVLMMAAVAIAPMCLIALALLIPNPARMILIWGTLLILPPYITAFYEAYSTK